MKENFEYSPAFSKKSSPFDYGHLLSPHFI